MPGACCRPTSCAGWAFTSRRNMGRRERVPASRVLALTVLAWLATSGVPAADKSGPVTQKADPLDAAKSAIRLKNFSSASTELQRLAASGNAEAQYLLAVLYLNGLNGARDAPAQARTWLEKSAAQGNAHAAFSLANLLASSEPPDTEGAQRWLKRARELGYTPAAQTGAREGLAVGFHPEKDLTDPAAKREAFWLAAEQGELERVNAFSDRTLIDSRDEFGRGALDRAARAGKADAVALLVKRGAAVDAADSFGTTALMLAARAGSAASVDALLKAGAKVDAADHVGNTALMQAVIGGDLGVVERLVAARANVALRNAQDWSALDFAETAGPGAAAIATRLRAGGAVALHRNVAITYTLTSVLRPT